MGHKNGVNRRRVKRKWLKIIALTKAPPLNQATIHQNLFTHRLHQITGTRYLLGAAVKCDCEFICHAAILDRPPAQNKSLRGHSTHRLSMIVTLFHGREKGLKQNFIDQVMSRDQNEFQSQRNEQCPA